MPVLSSPIRSPLRNPQFSPADSRWLGPPLSRFAYDIDFVAGTAKGGTQPYGSNTDDGRLFRDPTNVAACFAPAASGSLVSLGSAGLRRTNRGTWHYPSATVRNLWARDMTNAAWVSSGAGADITAAKDQVGMDGAANAASSLTCVNANGTRLQAITLASSVQLYYAFVKRLVGSGTISMTVDGDVTRTDITALINSSTYSLVPIPVQTVTNPSIGFKMATPGDKIAVDFNQTFSPPNVGVNIPNQCVVATTSATILNSQSRPSANNADAAPKSLITTAQGAFAFYWQGRSERTASGFIITGATGVFCSIQADNSIQFSDGVGSSRTAASLWQVGLGSVNKVAGYVTAGGAIKVACNGSVATAGTGATLETTLDHFDLCTNGAGQNSIYGLSERFAMSPNLTFTDAELAAMTT